jgi:hypothetical protein
MAAYVFRFAVPGRRARGDARGFRRASHEESKASAACIWS